MSIISHRAFSGHFFCLGPQGHTIRIANNLSLQWALVSPSTECHHQL